MLLLDCCDEPVDELREPSDDACDDALELPLDWLLAALDADDSSDERDEFDIGALPPFDHPHVYLDMGSDTEIVCPYCSTLFRYEPSVGHGHSKPAECEYHDTAAKAA